MCVCECVCVCVCECVCVRVCVCVCGVCAYVQVCDVCECTVTLYITHVSAINRHGRINYITIESHTKCLLVIHL